MSRAERVLLALLVALVLFSPVFLGGVRGFQQDWTGKAPTALERFLWAEGPWWIQAALAAAVAGAALVVATERRAAGEPEVFRLHGALLLPLAGLVLLALLQSVPLPRGLLGLLSPRAAAEAGRLLPGDGSWRPLTVSPEGTRRALAGMALGGAALLGTLLLARRRAAAAALLVAVAAAFTGAAAYGLASTCLGDDTVLGFPKRHGVGVTGPFLNRSHMAAGAGMALPVVLGLLWMGREKRLKAAVLSLLLLAAAAVLLATVPLARSRMGLAAGAFGLVVLGLLAARAVRWPPWAKALVAVLALGVAAAGVKTAVDQVPSLRDRFALRQTGRGFTDVRFPAWKATLALAARYPVLGTGLGSFETAIHETQTAENPDELVHAHSEPLEALAEGGVAGLLLGVLLAAGAVLACLRAAAADDPFVRAAGCACGGALAALLAGCTTEFHLHIPALGIAAAVLAGVPAGLLAGEPGPVPAAVPGRRLASWAAAGAVALAALVGLDSTRDAALCGEAVRAELGKDAAGWAPAARAATDADPSSAAAWRSLAQALAEAGDGAGALAAADRAVDLEPFHAYGHWARAVALLAKGGAEGEAAAAMDRALSRAGGIGHLHLAAGSVLLQMSLADPALRPRAFAALREAGAVRPQNFSAAWLLADQLEIPPAEREALAPDSSDAWWTIAGYWRSAGDGAREMRAWARAAAFSLHGASWREECLDAGRRAGLEEEARRLLGEIDGGR